MNTLKNKKYNKRKQKHQKKQIKKTKKNLRKNKSRKNLRKNKSRKQKGGNFFNFHQSPHMLPISKYGVTPNGVHLPENSNISYNPGYVQNGGFVNLGYSDHLINSADYVKMALENQWNALLGGDVNNVNPFPYNQSM